MDKRTRFVSIATAIAAVTWYVGYGAIIAIRLSRSKITSYPFWSGWYLPYRWRDVLFATLAAAIVAQVMFTFATTSRKRGG